MKNFNAEMIEKAKTVKSANEPLELAKAKGVEMTADEAATYFAQLTLRVASLTTMTLMLLQAARAQIVMIMTTLLSALAISFK